jgi:ubiquinone/menaquinone biosynthesis C-methylase UbiE
MLVREVAVAMTETINERVKRYVLDGTDQDLRRLLSISELSADMARTAFRRVGVEEGWNAIDCGCGPLGGLAVIAETVGPSGRVVGVDFNASAVQKARSVASALGLDNVEVVAGDINDMDPATLGGPFDLAYSRLFLMHQVDPVATLRQIAGLLRPGGWLVAQETLRTPPPRSHPDLEALTVYWDLAHQLLEHAGVPFGAIEDLGRSAREAGFEVSAMNGNFIVLDPQVGLEVHAQTLEAARERIVGSGVATDKLVDDLVLSMRAAKDGEYAWVTTPFFVELLLRKPMQD